MIRTALLLAAGLSLGGCAVGPDYAAPSIAPAVAYRNAPAATGSRPQPIPSDWWRGFGDPVLDRLEAEALDQNLDIAAAAARVMQARAAASAARAGLLPAGQLNGQAARQHASLSNANGALARAFPGYQRDASLYDVTAGASWELDVFGGLRREREAGAAEYQAALAGAAAARLMVSADVADHYLALRGAQARLELAGRGVAAASRLRDLVQLRLEAGQAPRRDLDAADVQLAQARSGQAQLRLAVEAELNALAILRGRTAEAERGDLERPAELPQGLPQALPQPPPVGLLAPGALLRNRPDLVAAERRLAAASARIGAAISDYFPKVSLQGVLGYEATRTGALFTSDALQRQGLVGVRWRLFDFGRVDAEVAAARGREAEALAGYRQAVLRATSDVENALMAGAEQGMRARDLHRGAEAADRQRLAAAAAYAAGQASLLEPLDAERQWLASLDQALAADTDAARALVALHRALGG